MQTTVFNLMSLVTWTLQAAILIGMHKRSLTREFRIFFAYTMFTLFLGLVETYCLIRFGLISKEYFTVYWLAFPVHIGLMFFVIQEVYANVLFRYEGLRSLSRIIFRWAFMLLVVLAVATAFTSPAADRDAIYSVILKIDYGTRIVEFGLIGLLFMLAKTFNLGWRDCAFGIAVGSCFYCSTELAMITLRTHYGNEAALLVAYLMPMIDILALGIWTAYVYRAEHKFAAQGAVLNPQLEEWNVAVLQFLNR